MTREKVINKVLHVQREPNGPWEIARGVRAGMVNGLAALSDEERLDIFRLFCPYCGDLKPEGGCCCMRDD